MIEVNYLAIIVSAVIATVLGMVWYGPLFGKAWLRVLKVSPNDMETQKKMKEGMMPVLATQILLTLFQVYVLAHFINAWSEASGVETALWIWTAFVMPMIAGMTMWSNDSVSLKWTRFLVQGGYQLACFLIFGAILGVWK